MPPTEKEFKASNFCPWPLFSKEDLVLRSPSRLWRPKPGDQSAAGTTPRSTPKSRQEGMTQKMENAQMKTAIELILKAGEHAGHWHMSQAAHLLVSSSSWQTLHPTRCCSMRHSGELQPATLAVQCKAYCQRSVSSCCVYV